MKPFKSLLVLGLVFTLGASATAQSLDAGPGPVNPTSVGTALPGQIPGETTNTPACTGCIGEVLTYTLPSGSAISILTSVPGNIISGNLTPGNWDVQCAADYFSDVGPIAYISVDVSLTTGTVEGYGTPALTQISGGNATSSVDLNISTGNRHISVSSNTTVFCVYRASVGTSISVYGQLRAIRTN